MKSSSSRCGYATEDVTAGMQSEEWNEGPVIHFR